MRKWAHKEQSFVGEEIAINQQHRSIYRKTIRVTSRLANNPHLQEERDEFRKLYEQELLEFESPRVEALMVQFDKALKECRPEECNKQELEELSYEFARQIKTELRQLDAECQAIAPGNSENTP